MRTTYRLFSPLAAICLAAAWLGCQGYPEDIGHWTLNIGKEDLPEFFENEQAIPVDGAPWPTLVRRAPVDERTPAERHEEAVGSVSGAQPSNILKQVSFERPDRSLVERDYRGSRVARTANELPSIDIVPYEKELATNFSKHQMRFEKIIDEIQMLWQSVSTEFNNLRRELPTGPQTGNSEKLAEERELSFAAAQSEVGEFLEEVPRLVQLFINETRHSIPISNITSLAGPAHQIEALTTRLNTAINKLVTLTTESLAAHRIGKRSDRGANENLENDASVKCHNFGIYCGSPRASENDGNPFSAASSNCGPPCRSICAAILHGLCSVYELLSRLSNISNCSGKNIISIDKVTSSVASEKSQPTESSVGSHVYPQNGNTHGEAAPHKIDVNHTVLKSNREQSRSDLPINEQVYTRNLPALRPTTPQQRATYQPGSTSGSLDPSAQSSQPPSRSKDSVTVVPTQGPGTSDICNTSDSPDDSGDDSDTSDYGNEATEATDSRDTVSGNGTGHDGNASVNVGQKFGGQGDSEDPRNTTSKVPRTSAHDSSSPSYIGKDNSSESKPSPDSPNPSSSSSANGDQKLVHRMITPVPSANNSRPTGKISMSLLNIYNFTDPTYNDMKSTIEQCLKPYVVPNSNLDGDICIIHSNDGAEKTCTEPLKQLLCKKCPP